MPLETKVGDATQVSRTANNGVIIAHIVNCKGAWGGGFVLALSKMSPIPVAAYRAWKEQSGGDIRLGETQFVEVTEGKFVANMCAQKSIDRADGPCLIDYLALERCLRVTFLRALRLGMHVHIPAGCGSGLAGGDKAKILGIIEAVKGKTETISSFAKWVKKHTDSPMSLNVTLWEFDDTTAVSYVPPSETKPVDLGSAAPVEQAGIESAGLTTPEDDIASL